MEPSDVEIDVEDLHVDDGCAKGWSAKNCTTQDDSQRTDVVFIDTFFGQRLI